MGMFSWLCKGCGGELCQPEIVRMNGFVGEYDGYGRVHGDGGTYEYGGNVEPACWHELCYQQATSQERLDTTPSKPAPNQGFGKPLKKFMAAVKEQPAQPAKPEQSKDMMLRTGPLAGHFMVKDDLIVCLKCGKDLTEAAKILGQPQMVMAHHAYSEALANFDSALRSFHWMRNRIEMPDSSTLDLHFSVVIKTVNDIIRAMAASNGMLWTELDPRDKK